MLIEGIPWPQIHLEVPNLSTHVMYLCLCNRNVKQSRKRGNKVTLNSTAYIFSFDTSSQRCGAACEDNGSGSGYDQ